VSSSASISVTPGLQVHLAIATPRTRGVTENEQYFSDLSEEDPNILGDIKK